MAAIIENIELDETNIEFNYASDFVKLTNKLVYITGKAGTGKTTFLKYLRETTTKNTVILAPTGVAAMNAGGQTIHSFFQIPPSIYLPNDKRLRTKAPIGDEDKSTIFDHFKYFKERLEIIRGLELLIIDEVSMVRCDLLDLVDRILRVFRKKENESFGGVQVILIGDTFQLPPIADFDQWELLSPHYKSPFFFSSKIIELNKPIYLELKKIYRQNEQEFIDLLNRIRINQVRPSEFTLLNSKYNPSFKPSKDSNFITLETHNKQVEATNLAKLEELPGECKSFISTISGQFPDNILPTDKVLQLKEGAQIMFIKNDSSRSIYNGRIAKINKIEDEGIIVELSENYNIRLEKQVWKNIKYTWNEKQKKIEEEVIGTFTQYPIKLAWAITVHKSQGLTFEKVIANLGSAFASGQVYVALSRCTSFSGLILKSRIEQNAIKTDPRVLEFAQNETPETLIVQELNSGKADFYYSKSREAFKQLNFNDAYDYFTKALKFRNDIETETFKKYFNVTTSKLISYKKKAIELEKFKHEYKESSDRYEDIIIVLEEDRKLEKASLENIIINLEEENRVQKEKLIEQNKALQLLLNKTKEIEQEKVNYANSTQAEMAAYLLEIEQDKKSIASLIKDIKELERKSRKQEEAHILELENVKEQLSKTKNTLNFKISRLEDQANNNCEEIERLRNLKWYQKLAGSK
jgi:hypothetical protein